MPQVYSRWWFWVLLFGIILFIIGIIVKAINRRNRNTTTNGTTTTNNTDTDTTGNALIILGIVLFLIGLIGAFVSAGDDNETEMVVVDSQKCVEVVDDCGRVVRKVCRPQPVCNQVQTVRPQTVRRVVRREVELLPQEYIAPTEIIEEIIQPETYRAEVYSPGYACEGDICPVQQEVIEVLPAQITNTRRPTSVRRVRTPPRVVSSRESEAGVGVGLGAGSVVDVNGSKYRLSAVSPQRTVQRASSGVRSRVRSKTQVRNPRARRQIPRLAVAN